MVAHAEQMRAAAGVLPAAVFVGWQRTGGIGPDFPLFDLVEDAPGHCAGSTVSEATLRALGLAVPNYPEVKRHPVGGGWTIAWPVSERGTARMYGGHWPSEELAVQALDGFVLRGRMGDFSTDHIGGRPTVIVGPELRAED